MPCVLTEEGKGLLSNPLRMGRPNEKCRHEGRGPQRGHLARTRTEEHT